MLLRSKEQ